HAAEVIDAVIDTHTRACGGDGQRVDVQVDAPEVHEALGRELRQHDRDHQDRHRDERAVGEVEAGRDREHHEGERRPVGVLDRRVDGGEHAEETAGEEELHVAVRMLGRPPFPRLDRFHDDVVRVAVTERDDRPDMRCGTVITLFHGYSHDIIMEAIETGKRWAAEHAGGDVQFLFAGGLFGVLAAVNSAVEDSYWTTLALVMLAVAACLYLTYGSLVAVAILMIPVVLSQLAAECFMYLWRIDLNVNSLPIAAAGAGVGVDYGIYHFSRMIDAFDEGRGLDEAVDYATATTGKAIIFTATTMVASTIFWWFSHLKFQAEMGFLLALLMVFNTFGGLVIVPA